MKNILKTFLSCCLWGLLYQFIAGYFFLHSWLNLFSELFRFADREFYSVRKTSTYNSSTIFLYLSGLVDVSWFSFLLSQMEPLGIWLDQGIYLCWSQRCKLIFHTILYITTNSIPQLINKKWYNKIAFLPTILISALFHEYVLWAPLRSIMPLLLLLFGTFGCKSIFIFSIIPTCEIIRFPHPAILFIVRPSPTVKFWNYFLHFGLHFGVSIMIFLYTMEFYARHFCPSEGSFIQTFIPRMYDCYYVVIK